MSVPDIIGLVGAVFYLSAYAFLQLRIFTVDHVIITIFNILGGIALIYSLSWSFNLGSFITQVAWFAFTIIGFVRFRLNSRSKRAITE